MNIIYNQKLRLEHMFFLKEVRSAILIKKKKKKITAPDRAFSVMLIPSDSFSGGIVQQGGILRMDLTLAFMYC
jgi:hypothetical protein